MTKQNKIQLRGHCPCCGNLQAVVRSGLMSKHGYTVNKVWNMFEGTCPGQNHRPIEKDLNEVNRVISSALAQAAELEERANNLESGKIVPLEARNPVYGRNLPEFVPFDTLNEYHKERAVKSAINQAHMQANMARSWAKTMQTIADTCHGQPLIEVDKEANAVHVIQIGEKRQSIHHVLTCVSIEGARIYYTYETTNNEGQVREYRTWQGSSAWRRLPLID